LRLNRDGAAATQGVVSVESQDREVIELRRKISALRDEAKRNEDAWKRSQQREMELLEADTLGILLERLTHGLQQSYRLTAVTLVLADPHHEIRHLLMAQGDHATQHGAVLFVDSAHSLAPQLAAGRRPWLGQFVRADHELLFPGASSLSSVALLPLTRQGRIIGSLNLGTTEARRFAGNLATDFLHHLAVIAAFCLENAVNRARLVRSGFTDVLTGWRNRRYLQTRLREELARCNREGTSLTCLMIDVDHFKRVNDRYGHLVGDEVLRQLAQCVEGEVRNSDVSARYGGEEFVILLPATGIAAGRLLAERIRSAVCAERFELSDVTEPLPITVSIGVAEYHPSPKDDLKLAGERLIAKADLALYEAKANGRNTVVEAG
jgi:diguanylate cyclase (GGDEF)-like protein